MKYIYSNPSSPERNKSVHLEAGNERAWRAAQRSPAQILSGPAFLCSGLGPADLADRSETPDSISCARCPSASDHAPRLRLPVLSPGSARYRFGLAPDQTLVIPYPRELVTSFRLLIDGPEVHKPTPPPPYLTVKALALLRCPVRVITYRLGCPRLARQD